MTKRLLSQELANIIIEDYPVLIDNRGYRKLILKLIFSKNEDNYTLVDRVTLASCEDCLKELRSGHRYSAIKYLTKFQQEVGLKLYIKEYNYINGKARMVKPFFSINIQQAIQQELSNFTISKDITMVNFITLKKASKNTPSEIRKELDKEVKRFYDNASVEALPLLEYLNDLPSNLFTNKVKQNKDYVCRALSNLESSETNPKLKPVKDATLREIETKILMSIYENPKPLYKPSLSGKTVRIFSHGESILLLCRKLRKAICKGWYEYDLVSSQLAIVAKLWNITEVQEFLHSGSKIWVSLFEHLGVKYAYNKLNNPDWLSALKDLLKESLYSLIYGMEKSCLLARLTKGLKKLKIDKKGIDVLNHPIMATLYKAREAKITTVLQDGKLVLDWYGGRELLVEGSTTKERLDCVRSLLAQEAQLVEMLLLKSVFDIAKENKQYMAITLFQHDGFTVHYNKATLVNSLEYKMRKAIRLQAGVLGIITDLEGGLIEG